MNKLTSEKRAAVISALVEGCSIRSTVRMTGVAKNTVVRLLADAGRACAAYSDKMLRDLPIRRVQCDEIWSFCYAKQKNVPTAKAAPDWAGDVWTWTAIDADTKLMPCWAISTTRGATSQRGSNTPSAACRRPAVGAVAGPRRRRSAQRRGRTRSRSCTVGRLQGRGIARMKVGRRATAEG